jgi:hypothetical protein
VHDESFNPTTSTRRDSLYIGSDRISPRAIDTTRGSAISLDSIISFDGVSSSFQWRTEIEAERQTSIFGRKRSGMKFIKKYPISVSWWIGLLSLGLILQVVIK